MKTLILISALFISSAYAQADQKKKDMYAQDKMDYGDKQLLRRDACRKPIEALESKYNNIKKEDLEKMKEECGR